MDIPLEPTETDARQMVERFVRRFDESYRLLACHAALPLVLTPELVHYLRNTFLRGQVAWVAEVDLLLSELCRPVGYEQYAMDAAVRAYLMAELRERVGLPRLQEVARLLIHYVQHLHQTGAPFSPQELQAQQLAAMVCLDDQRDQAAHELVEALQQNMAAAADSPQSTGHRAELARLARLTQTLAPQLAAHPELVAYAGLVGRMVADPVRTMAEAGERDISRVDSSPPSNGEADNLTTSVYLAAHPHLSATAGAHSGEYLIDLRSFFYQGNPPPMVWEQQIIPQLEKQLVALRTMRQKTIQFRAFAHNSAALAFGFVFRQKTGFQIVYTDNNNQTWDTARVSEEISPLIRVDSSMSLDTTVTMSPTELRQGLAEILDETELYDLCLDMDIDYENLPGVGKTSKVRELVRYCQRRSRYDELVQTYQRLQAAAAPAVPDATDLILELAITQPAPRVQEQVDRWIRQYQPAVRKRILLELRRDPLPITPPEGAAIAQQVCGIIQREGTFSGTTHLFGAMPLGVALLIGWNLQSVGKIQCYELDRNNECYQPTCLIRAF